MSEQMSEQSIIDFGKCRCCLTEMDINELRSIFTRGKICGQITKLAEMLKYTTSLEVSFYNVLCLCFFVNSKWFRITKWWFIVNIKNLNKYIERTKFTILIDS